MSEHNKIIELKEEELEKVTGGSGEGNYKYNVGYIFYEEGEHGFLYYFVITGYDAKNSNKPYLCDLYLIDPKFKEGYKATTDLPLSQSIIDSHNSASSIPYVS